MDDKQDDKQPDMLDTTPRVINTRPFSDPGPIGPECFGGSDFAEFANQSLGVPYEPAAGSGRILSEKLSDEIAAKGSGQLHRFPIHIGKSGAVPHPEDKSKAAETLRIIAGSQMDLLRKAHGRPTSIEGIANEIAAAELEVARLNIGRCYSCGGEVDVEDHFEADGRRFCNLEDCQFAAAEIAHARTRRDHAERVRDRLSESQSSAASALSLILDPEAIKRVKLEELSQAELTSIERWANSNVRGYSEADEDPPALRKALLEEMYAAAEDHNSETEPSVEAKELGEALKEGGEEAIKNLLAKFAQTGNSRTTARIVEDLVAGAMQDEAHKERRPLVRFWKAANEVDESTVVEKGVHGLDDLLEQLDGWVRAKRKAPTAENVGKVQSLIHRATNLYLPRGSEGIEDPGDRPSKIEVELPVEAEIRFDYTGDTRERARQEDREHKMNQIEILEEELDAIDKASELAAKRIEVIKKIREISATNLIIWGMRRESSRPSGLSNFISSEDPDGSSSPIRSARLSNSTEIQTRRASPSSSGSPSAKGPANYERLRRSL